jgi:hypothetical protein
MHTEVLSKTRLYLALMLLLCLFTEFARAQRVSVGMGLTGGGVQVATTMRAVAFQSANNVLTTDTLTRPGSLAPFLGLQVPIYARLFHLGADRSIGLALSPMFGFYIPAQSTTSGNFLVSEPNADTYGGTVLLHMPVMLHFAQGMFSTSETTKESGWGVGLGVEGTWMNDGWNIARNRDGFLNSSYILAPSVAIRPVGAIYWRKWSKRDVPVEWSLQFSTTQLTYELGTINRPMIRLSRSAYLNY